MPSTGMLRRLAVVRIDVSEERGILFLRSLRRLLLTANVSSSFILVTLMMEAVCSIETSVLTRSTRRNVPEDGILRECSR
jgi:hypothetical protein